MRRKMPLNGATRVRRRFTLWPTKCRETSAKFSPYWKVWFAYIYEAEEFVSGDDVWVDIGAPRMSKADAETFIATERGSVSV